VKSAPVATPAIGADEAARRLAADPRDLDAALARADHLYRAGDHRQASALYAHAARLGSARARDMALHLEARFADHLLASLAAAGFGPGACHPRFAAALDMLLGRRQRLDAGEEWPQEPNVLYYPGLPTIETFDPSAFDWAPALERETPAIRAEALALAAGEGTFAPYVAHGAARPADYQGLLGNADWSASTLIDNGRQLPLADRCPATMAALARVPLTDIPARTPSVLFSMLRPGAHIPPHCGMLNIRLIAHLPLVVPPGCGFRVGATRADWREGELLIFDDSIEHEAWNRGRERRLVLLLDVWRPELEAAERAQLRALFAAIDHYA
jgi:hypothetical protein